MASSWSGSTRRVRLPKGWAAIRRRILERDGGICHVCHGAGADEVDHLVAGDDHRDTNLAAIHKKPCHARKSAREGAAARTHVPLRRPAEKHPGVLS